MTWGRIFRYVSTDHELVHRKIVAVLEAMPEFLEAIADPKHERHAELLEWIGGKFDPEQFDAKTATMAMMKAVRRSQ